MEQLNKSPAMVCMMYSFPLGDEKKKQPCFMGGRTSQVGSVGLDFFFLILFFLFLVQKVP